MTDPTEQPTPKRFLSHAFIPALGVCVLAAAALLYVTIGSGGKETAEAKACAANAAQRAAVDRAAKGEVAALAIAKESKPVTPLAFSGPDGQPETLDAFRGRVVLLNLWATWCVPCRQEIPEFNKMQAELGSKGVEVVGISMDEDGLEPVKAFLKQNPMKYTVGLGTGSPGSLPITVVLDKAGNQVGRFEGFTKPEVIRAAVDKAL